MEKKIDYNVYALYLWAISQEMPAGMYEHVETYNLELSTKKYFLMVIYLYIFNFLPKYEPVNVY